MRDKKMFVGVLDGMTNPSVEVTFKRSVALAEMSNRIDPTPLTVRRSVLIAPMLSNPPGATTWLPPRRRPPRIVPLPVSVAIPMAMPADVKVLLIWISAPDPKRALPAKVAGQLNVNDPPLILWKRPLLLTGPPSKT